MGTPPHRTLQRGCSTTCDLCNQLRTWLLPPPWEGAVCGFLCLGGWASLFVASRVSMSADAFSLCRSLGFLCISLGGGFAIGARVVVAGTTAPSAVDVFAWTFRGFVFGSPYRVLGAILCCGVSFWKIVLYLFCPLPWGG